MNDFAIMDLAGGIVRQAIDDFCMALCLRDDCHEKWMPVYKPDKEEKKKGMKPVKFTAKQTRYNLDAYFKSDDFKLFSAASAQVNYHAVLNFMEEHIDEFYNRLVKQNDNKRHINKKPLRPLSEIKKDITALKAAA